MEIQRTQKSWNNLEKEKQNEGAHTSQLQNLLQSNGNQDSMPLAQQIRTDSPETNPHIYGQLILTRPFNREKTVSLKWCWNNWVST
jgi:hypothetical protein